MAHNFKGYDSYPIIETYHKRCQFIDQLRVGGKVLQLTSDKIFFIDSLSFFQMPWSSFPKTFGLNEFEKRHLPHGFNTPYNQDYIGCLPDKKYYFLDSMSINAKKKFDDWYATEIQLENEFNFQEELEKYCKSDVLLLRQGCLKFQEDFKQKTNFSPFDHPTIASACNRDLRMNRMEKDTIASEPLLGWRIISIDQN